MNRTGEKKNALQKKHATHSVSYNYNRTFLYNGMTWPFYDMLYSAGKAYTVSLIQVYCLMTVYYSLFFLTWPLSYPKTDDNNIEQGQNPGAELRKTDCREGITNMLLVSYKVSLVV